MAGKLTLTPSVFVLSYCFTGASYLYGSSSFFTREQSYLPLYRLHSLTAQPPLSALLSTIYRMPARSNGENCPDFLDLDRRQISGVLRRIKCRLVSLLIWRPWKTVS